MNGDEPWFDAPLYVSPVVHLMVPLADKPDAYRLACGANLRESGPRVTDFDGPEPVTCEPCRRRHLGIPAGFAEPPRAESSQTSPGASS